TENAPKTAKNQGFERPQRRRCGLLHFPTALIRPSLTLCRRRTTAPVPSYWKTYTRIFENPTRHFLASSSKLP
ncbi:hypothetical protein BRM28_00425, partial [Xanthomonas oryzae pv. oryzae]